MKFHRQFAILLSVACFGIAGCATISPPRGEAARATVSAEHTRSLRVESAAFEEVDGQLVFRGRVRRPFRWLPTGESHVDVEFLDASRRQLALKSVALSFQRRRFGPPPPAMFSISADPWPAGATAVIVRPHAGATHQPKTS